MPLVSIIILNYKNADLTAECVRSIVTANLKVDHEIIVVDNDSQDGSYTILRDELSQFAQIIASPFNCGFSRGNNLGASYASGRYFFFLNNDTLLKPFVLEEMIGILENDSRFGAITCQSTNGKDEYLNNGHPFPSVLTMLKEIYIRPLIPEFMRAKLRQVKSGQDTGSVTPYDWISGSALLISSELFNKIGGWDEDYFMYMEDVSLCQEVARANKICGVYERHGFVHFHGDASGSERVVYEAGRSEILYYRKYPTGKTYLNKWLAIIRARKRAKTFGHCSVRRITDSLRRI